MPDPYQLVASTNHIGQILDRLGTARGRRKRQLVAEALRFSCRALDDLGPLETDSPSSADRLWERDWKRAVLEVSRDRSQFERFLAVERALLIASGMDEPITDWIMDQIRFVPLRVGGDQDQLNGDALERAVRRLRDHVCQWALEAEQRCKAKELRRGLIASFGGFCTISVNLASDGILGGVATAASAGAGLKLMQDGIRALEDEG